MPARYELLLRFNNETGDFKGALARYSDGSLMPINSETLGSHLSEAFIQVLAAHEALTVKVASLTEAKNVAVSELAARTTQCSALQAQLDAIASAAKQKVESHKARIELTVRNEWSKILELVENMTEPQRAIVTEALYAPYYHKDSPTLRSLARARGWSDAYFEELWAASVGRVV